MSILNSDLQRFLKELTNEPGVYQMINSDGVVLYVGKAANLKKRVNSYFRKQKQLSKTTAMVKQIAKIEVTVTKSETEALLLESSLIKTLRPKYNVLMRDDKSYPYIRVTSHPDFPRMDMFRSKRKPVKGKFFGPYPNVLAVKNTINIIQKVFKIRNCSDVFFNSRSRPCLQYQIKRCTAPCVKFISKEDYRQSLQDAIDVLQGKSQDVVESIERRMKQAVADMAFEEAASMRDQIKSLRAIQEQQSVVHIRGDADIVAIGFRASHACIQSVSVREGQVIASQSFYPKIPQGEIDPDELWQQTFKSFIGSYYLEEPARIPKEIVTERKAEDEKLIEDALSEKRGSRCSIRSSVRGAKKRWLDFAQHNLQLALTEKYNKASTIEHQYQVLGQFLNFDKPISHMECFDISHTQGDETIASCVVFNDKGPAKNYYRRFNIKGITKSDDYAAMEQAIKRRFQRLLSQDAELPDVLVIDGGKGQVEVARRILEELNINAVKILGVAKGPSRKAGWEKLILVDEDKEIVLSEDSPALHLLQQIRDEAHRFAITSHRKKRQKKFLESSLESIEGIGSKRRQALLLRFGGLRELAKAPVEEILKVPGIHKKLAVKIYELFH